VADDNGLWFVYRSHYEGPLSKHVRRLEAPSLLEWFRGLIRQARDASDPRKLAEEVLGVYVYGFGSFVKAAKEKRFALPRSTGELRSLLEKHLYVEGGRDNIRLDSHTLRVLTDDDEVSLAYFFFDDHAERKHPDRVTYLLIDDPRLPDGEVEDAFESPVETAELLPAGGHEGATYACLLTFSDSDSLPGKARVFRGVRLPDLADHLRRVIPHSEPQKWSAEWLKTWPLELRLLRAMLDEGDRTLAAALERVNSYPPWRRLQQINHTRLGIGPHDQAREEFLSAAVDDNDRGRGDPSLSVIHQGEHVAAFCIHATEHFGHQQWILFDDLWAAAHPELASSLLHYASHWDPFHGLQAARNTR
jgi:hypothetical protein